MYRRLLAIGACVALAGLLIVVTQTNWTATKTVSTSPPSTEVGSASAIPSNSPEPSAQGAQSAHRSSLHPTPSPTSLPSNQAQKQVLTPPAGCPAGLVVSTAAGLNAALAAATPGAVIDLASGVYTGNFVATTSGTATAPITLCGAPDAIIDGGSTGGRTFHLDGASWWHLSGFQIQHGNKALGLTRASHNTVSGLYIHDSAGALVHINSFSSDNLFDHLKLRNTPKEGFYIGSTHSNWCMYSNCQPDASDRNVIQNSDVAGTGSEPVNIQEGSSGGSVLNSKLDGSALHKAKEWVNVKGNGYLVAGNTGTNSIQDGFDVHENATGWGNNNTFQGNHATVNGPGYGYYIQPGTKGNHLLCDNTATAAARGFANVACG